MISLRASFSGLMCFFALLGGSVQAAPVSVNYEVKSYLLQGSVEYFEDPSGLISVDALRQSSNAEHWKMADESRLNFGFSQSTYWFRITMVNQNDKESRLLLEVDNPLLDELDLFLFSADQLINRFETGDSKPFSQRADDHLIFTFPFVVPVGESVTLLLRVHSEGSVQVPLSLWNYDDFHHEEEYGIIIQSIYFGVLLFMAVFNLFVYFRTFAASYLYFVGYVLSIGLLLAGMTGYGYKYLWSFSVEFQALHIATFLSFAGLFLAAFIYHYLNLNRTRSMMGKLLLAAIIAFTIMLLLSSVISYHLLVQLALLLFFMLVNLGLWGGLNKWGGIQHTSMVYFTIAWLQMVLCGIAIVLAKFGIIAITFISNDMLPWTVLIQVILLSMALGERMNIERKQRITAQRELMNIQDVHKKELEDEVARCTEELVRANKTLEILATTDALTGICNRRYFLEQAQHMINVALRYHHPIAMVMLDIDHFKAVNDSYGHAAGDHVLNEITANISLQTRKTDIFARVGGEEFAMLLIDTAPDMAVIQIERIRESIEQMAIVL